MASWRKPASVSRSRRKRTMDGRSLAKCCSSRRARSSAVTAVTDVRASVSAGFGVTSRVTSDVTGVTASRAFSLASSASSPRRAGPRPDCADRAAASTRCARRAGAGTGSLGRPRARCRETRSRSRRGGRCAGSSRSRSPAARARRGSRGGSGAPAHALRPSARGGCQLQQPPEPSSSRASCCAASAASAANVTAVIERAASSSSARTTASAPIEVAG